MQVCVRIQMPDPIQSSEAAARKPSIEERVREAVELCESGYSSHTDWLMLNKLRDALLQKKRTPRVDNLLGMIQPLLNKYGYHGTSEESGESQEKIHLEGAK